MFWELLITACTSVCAPVSPLAGNASSWYESLHKRALEPAISFAADTAKSAKKNKVKKVAAKIQPCARQNQKDLGRKDFNQKCGQLDVHVQGPQNLVQTTEMRANLKKTQAFGVFWRDPPILLNIGRLQSFCRASYAFGTEGLQALAGISPVLPGRRGGFLSEASVSFAKQKASVVGKQFSTGYCPSKGKTSALASSMPLFRVGGTAIAAAESVLGSVRSSIKSSISIKSSLFAVIQSLQGSRLPLGKHLANKQVRSLFAGVAPQTV